MEPWWNFRGTFPQGRPGPPRSLSGLRPQSFQLLGKNKNKKTGTLIRTSLLEDHTRQMLSLSLVASVMSGGGCRFQRTQRLAASGGAGGGRAKPGAHPGSARHRREGREGRGQSWCGQRVVSTSGQVRCEPAFFSKERRVN